MLALVLGPNKEGDDEFGEGVLLPRRNIPPLLEDKLLGASGEGVGLLTPSSFGRDRGTLSRSSTALLGYCFLPFGVLVDVPTVTVHLRCG